MSWIAENFIPLGAPVGAAQGLEGNQVVSIYMYQTRPQITWPDNSNCHD